MLNRMTCRTRPWLKPMALLLFGFGMCAVALASDRQSGTVKWFDVQKGFGFITPESGQDLFVHARSIQGNDIKCLKEGEQVTFKVVQGQKGLQADEVQVGGGGSCDPVPAPPPPAPPVTPAMNEVAPDTEDHALDEVDADDSGSEEEESVDEEEFDADATTEANDSESEATDESDDGDGE